MKSDSGLNWIELRELIEAHKTKCGNPDAEVYGVDINKQFIPTRAVLDGVDVSKYYNVPPHHFACNLMHIGRDIRIPIAYNDSENTYVVTSAYYIFRVKSSQKESVLDEYLYMYLNSSEKDRMSWFYTDGSVRGNLPESRLLDITIPIPSIEKQRVVVDAWKSLRRIKEENEALAAPLMQLCQSYIQECRKNYPQKELGPFIKESDIRNIDNKFTSDNVRGVSIQKIFIPTKADMTGVPVSSYKIVNKDMFAFNPNTARMGDKFSIAINQSDETYLVSSIYPVFYVSSNELNPSFLKMWFERVDFDRYARYHSWGSAREMFNFSDMQRVKLPIPPIEVQQAIVSLYHSALEYKSISEMADAESRRICPALLQHVIKN